MFCELTMYGREPGVIKRAIKLAKSKGNKIICETRGFDFEQKYGERGKGFIEGHHKTFLSKAADENGQETKPEDIALLCSNCHSMIHRRKPWLTIEELREIIEANN